MEADTKVRGAMWRHLHMMIMYNNWATRNVLKACEAVCVLLSLLLLRDSVSGEERDCENLIVAALAASGYILECCYQRASIMCVRV